SRPAGRRPARPGSVVGQRMIRRAVPLRRRPDRPPLRRHGRPDLRQEHGRLGQGPLGRLLLHPEPPPAAPARRTTRCVRVTNARTAASVTGSQDGQNPSNDLSVPAPPDQPPWYLFCAHSTPSSTIASTTSAARSTRNSDSLRSAPEKSDKT